MYVFSAIVILIISSSDEAESKSMEIDRRLERAVEAWRNGTSLAQADTGNQISRLEADDADAVTSMKTGSDRQASSILNDADAVTSIKTGSDRRASSISDDANAVTSMKTGSDRQAHSYENSITDPETGIKYGCYLNECWRTCRKREQDPDGWWKKHSPPSSNYEWQTFCKNDHGPGGWCYSDLGSCSYNSGCSEAVKWGCYGTGYGRDRGFVRGRVIMGARPSSPCYPHFQKYYCDKKSGKSFGCAGSSSLCWRSCDPGQEEPNYCWRRERKNGRRVGGYWCHVNAGLCSTDNRCIVATALACKYEVKPGLVSDYWGTG